MKKWYVAVLTAVLLLSLISCGTESGSPEPVAEETLQSAEENAEQAANESDTEEMEEEEEEVLEGQPLSPAELLEDWVRGTSSEEFPNLSYFSDGTYEEINGERCEIFHAGEDHEDHFVTLHFFAVSEGGAIYEEDIITQEYEPRNALAILKNAGVEIPETALGVVITQDAAELFYEMCQAYDAGYYSLLGSGYVPGTDSEEISEQVGFNFIVSFVNMLDYSVSNVEFNEETYELDVTSIENQGTLWSRGNVVCEFIWMTEAIPSMSLTVTDGSEEYTWYAAYDGRDEGGISFLGPYDGED